VETVVKKCFLSEETKCREMYHEARTLQSVEMRKEPKDRRCAQL